MEPRECIACGGRRSEVLLSPREVEVERRFLRRFYACRLSDGASVQDRTDFTQDADAFVVRCARCGTLSRVPSPDKDELRKAYERDRYGRPALEALAANQEAFHRARSERLRSLLPSGSHVLEVGAFVGGFLTVAREIGWSASGVDVGSETTAFMRRRGLDVCQCDVLDLSVGRGTLDGVFIWNTFDQLSEPRAVLGRVHAELGPGGLLALRVPNGAFATACRALLGKADPPRRANVRRALAFSNFLTLPYLTMYTPAALTDILASAGFQVGAIEGDNIATLADKRTLSCAVLEEGRVKRAIRRAWRAAFKRTNTLYAPWMDVYAVKV